nr:DUF1109 domain-containing protein [Schlegelella koreensis]
MLARRAEPVPRHALRDRLLVAVAIGLPLAVLLVALLLGLRHDLAEGLRHPVLWVKFAVPLAVALAAGASLRRLASPGVPVGRTWWIGAGAVLALWVVAALQWAGLSPTERAVALWGSSWRECPFNIAVVSLPLLAAVLAMLRGPAAPTRPRRAGAAAGLLAGGMGTMAYALHCPESGLAFVAVWYVLGVVIVAAAGAALGPRLFRW